MAEVDPETLLEWLSMGQGDERDMQVSISVWIEHQVNCDQRCNSAYLLPMH